MSEARELLAKVIHDLDCRDGAACTDDRSTWERFYRLADAGWVDPEEARVIIEQRDRAWRKQAGAEKDRDWLTAERDALLPVVEAARAVDDAWRNQEGTGVRLVEPLRRLAAAVDALDQKAPETALSATQKRRRRRARLPVHRMPPRRAWLLPL
jgi:hypothetical protein